MIKKVYKSKKAVSPSVFTWIVAMLIILFMSLIFVFFSSLIGAGKIISGNIGVPVNLEKQQPRVDLFQSIALDSFLNLQFNEKYRNKELIGIWADESNKIPDVGKRIEEKAKEFLSLYSLDYSFIKIISAKGEILVPYLAGDEERRYSKSNKRSIFSERGNLIEVIFYGGER